MLLEVDLWSNEHPKTRAMCNCLPLGYVTQYSDSFVLKSGVKFLVYLMERKINGLQ